MKMKLGIKLIEKEDQNDLIYQYEWDENKNFSEYLQRLLINEKKEFVCRKTYYDEELKTSDDVVLEKSLNDIFQLLESLLKEEVEKYYDLYKCFLQTRETYIEFNTLNDMYKYLKINEEEINKIIR